MSLFRTKEWWRTECCSSSGQQPESFDHQSLLVVRGLLAGVEQEVIVVASHGGYLRIYSPVNEWNEEERSPGAYKSTDLVVEAKLAECIIDVKAGSFVS